jgi:hypothetical protein
LEQLIISPVLEEFIFPLNQLKPSDPQWFFEYFPQVLDFLDNHPYIVISTALALGIISSILFRLLRSIRRCAERGKMISLVGLHSFMNHSDSSERKLDWSICVDRINSNSSDLRILGATGWNTFGANDSPLHDVLNDFQGEIKILLMSPDCPYLSERATSVHMTEDNYKKEIQNSIEHCRELKNKNINIHVKFYTQYPIWKMVITGHFLWLQYYRLGSHVEETPVYGFYNNANHTSLFDPLFDVFRKRWELDSNYEVNLT